MEWRETVTAVRDSGLFDEVWYVEHYPEVRFLNLDPIEHYVLLGSRMNYFPSLRFRSLGNPKLLLEKIRNGPLRIAPKTAPKSTSYSADARASVSGLHISVSGWARDNKRQGLPVWLAIFVGDRKCTDVLARTISPSTDTGTPPNAYRFKAEFSIRPREVASRISVHFDDGGVQDVDYIEPLAPASSGDEIDSNYNVTPRDSVIGNIEVVSRERIRGWALCQNNKDAQVDLILEVNGRPFSHARCAQWRADVKGVHGGHGFHGFVFDLPPNLALTGSVKAKVRPAVGVSLIKKAEFDIKSPGSAVYPASQSVSLEFGLVPTVERPTSVSLVVINRNGAGLLTDLFTSAKAHESGIQAEWIIVDHQSSDGSDRVCLTAKEHGLNVTFVQRGGNFSYSDSNNFGARAASGDIVVFINNDIIFHEPIVERIISCFADPRVGAVGVKLTDYIDNENWREQGPIQHLGVHFQTKVENGWLRPYEDRLVSENRRVENSLVEVPSATAALLAMRKSEFLSLGGFSGDFFYGLEDIDLCLRIQSTLSKSIVCLNSVSAAHHRGFSREKDRTTGNRRKDNDKYLTRKWASFLRRNIKSDVLRRPAFWTGRRPVVGFIVSEATDNTAAGDFFTASELGKSLQALGPFHVRYMGKEEWEDLSSLDVLIVMVDTFKLESVKICSPFLITVAWVRNWFDRWADSSWIHSYDHVWASSGRGAEYLKERLDRHVDVVPIASNIDTFSTGKFRDGFASDYCFTGNRTSLPREIEFNLKPELVRGRGAVFGHNWADTSLGSIAKGPVGYSEMANVYASTKIVIDDANIATKRWGSCNSRVFDAIASGALVVTNGELGARELFGSLLPTYNDERSLTQGINYWLTHEKERQERVELLQKLVREKHTYRRRAEAALVSLTKRPRKRISIKCASKKAEEREWGDFHFASSLARALRKEGYTVRIDSREHWTSGISETDDVVIVLRGLIAYEPKPSQKNILWLISHPNDVSITELAKYDHVYVASDVHAALLKDMCDASIEALPQCVDTDRFVFDPNIVKNQSERAVFVGNSRLVYRDAVRWSMEKGLDVDVFGNDWESFIPASKLRGLHVPNEMLGELYGSHRFVLCDHWSDMKKLGYISNRVFDVLAVGGELVVDEVVGLRDLIPSGFHVFRNAEDLDDILRHAKSAGFEEKQDLAKWVARNHSFSARARKIAEKLKELDDDTEDVPVRAVA